MTTNKQYTFNHENDYLNLMLDTLMYIKNKPNKKSGICHYFSEYLWGRNYGSEVVRKCRYILLLLFKEWPENSGENGFPVPVTNPKLYESPSDQYFSTFGVRWEGEYGQLRKELLDFCIDSITLALEMK